MRPPSRSPLSPASTGELNESDYGRLGVGRMLLADFYRAGDGIEESFTARMIVSTSDIAADVPGVQTLWVQGAGCGDAAVQFSR